MAVLLAMAGLGVLTLDDTSGLGGVGYGEALIFAAALLYALHIVGLGAWSTPHDAVGMALIQCLVIAAVCGVAAAPGGIVLPDRLGDWLSILYMAVFAGAGALLGQTWAQAHLPPTRSAIIMTMEPVFAAFFAVLLGGESVDHADAPRRRPGARGDADRRARAAPADRGRGAAHRRLRPDRDSGCWNHFPTSGHPT